MLIIACVNAGNYLGRGEQYVNILFDMVCRNISEKIPFQFQCFNDAGEGTNPGIRYRKLPEGLKGWWNKLYLFKDGVFSPEDRVIFMDLDTVIVGGLDDILKYDGQFAILRDFYRPHGLQSSLMSWKPSAVTAQIWDSWALKGGPDLDGGDQAWIEASIANVDRWQDILPGQFVSYKVHCPLDFPKGSRVVIFHGEPRPHDVTTGFMPHIWKIGGGTTQEIESVCNTAPSQLEENITHAASLDRPWLDMREENGKAAVIVGGGPSLNDNLEEIRKAQESGAAVFATNNTAKKLIANGIVPDFHILGDARPENADFVPSDHWDGVHAIYSSQCHKAVFDAAAAMDGTIYHPFIPGIQDVIGTDKPYALIGGGNTTGLQALSIAYVMGYRALHLYGFDSSYRDGQGHAYAQKLNDGEQTMEVQVNGRRFTTAVWMASQVEQFRQLAQTLVGEGCSIAVYGDGLLPYVASLMQHKEAA